jgi:hypothetical protein
LQLFCKFSAKCQIPNFLQSDQDVLGQLTHSLQARRSWTLPYVCMNKISLLKWWIVIVAPPFGWCCEVTMASLLSSFLCDFWYKFYVWLYSRLILLVSSFLCDLVLRVVVFTIDFQIATRASVCFSFGQWVTFFLCFPLSLQHGPWVLTLCMTGNCFWVTVRSRIWLFVKICWVSTQNEVLKHTCNNAWHICLFSY